MASSDANDLPFFERPDLSPYLVHLTKSSKDGFSAYQNLISILGTGEIFASETKSGFIKGQSGAACFMDIPLSSLKYVLNEANTDPKNPRYSAFGVILTKKFAYKNGCRPVLYLSNQELEDLGIPQRQLWRVVRLEGVDGTGINWVHEREWRCKGAFDLPKKILAVLVQTTTDAKRLREHIHDDPHFFKVIPSAIIPLSILCQGLPYISSD